ncbi:MAG: phosphate acetyltransferase [Clostridiales bacterium]|nr:phosphate acetyltransferase [Clostridiales bacterium]
MKVNIEKVLIDKAKKLNKTIIFPEAAFSERILNAGQQIALEGIANVVFVGAQALIQSNLKPELVNKITIVDPQNCPLSEKLSNIIYEKRKSKGLSLEEAQTLCQDPIYFACAYVCAGLADGIVCGAEVSTAKTLKPALQLIKSKTGLVSSYFLFSGENKVTDEVFMMGDCAVVEDPTVEQQAQIANLMLSECKRFNLFEPRFAFLSYSTCGSAKSNSTTKVRQAYELFSNQNPNIHAVGEVQFDASIKQSIAKTKKVAFTKPANMFVMPNIDAGNICYKAIQYFGGLTAIGPITMGFNKPVNDLSRGCTVQDIILVTAITALQCE